ncbi:MAG: gliding motility-associated C-terminal domain-containing protein [Bacteroidota bacterium]|nr:gliding motility-associated C-terminal domain-containing protein [Bacteroidota bacterium]
MSTYYNASNDNLDNFKDRLSKYEEQPDAKIWDNIEKHLDKKGFPFKSLSLVGIVLLAIAVMYFVFIPNKQQSTIALQNNKTNSIIKNKSVASTIITNIITLEENLNNTKASNKQNISSNSSTLEQYGQETSYSDINTQEQSILDIVVESEPMLEQEKQAIVTNTDSIAPPLSTTPTKKIDVPLEEVPEAEELFIPNAFTPGEATNNIFKPESEKQISEFEMKIFSRTGMQVYSSKNINEGWNGDVKGSMAPKGVYVYIITYKDSQNKKHTQKGSLLLLR